jgi:hypothetical protein
LPAVLGVLLVAALAYWGQYARQAPNSLLALAVVASVLSLIMSWTNTRYVARRLERLTSPPDASTSRLGLVRAAISGALRGREAEPARPDEIDEIERVVDHLSGAVAEAEALGAAREAAADEERRAYATLVASATDAVERRLEEIRLPLHILLENRFGDLNENQEEMLGDARAAAEAADVELTRLRAIADHDSDAVKLRHDRVRVGDVLRSLLPILVADGQRRLVRVDVDIAPAMPAIRADRRALQQALELLLRDELRRTADGGELHLAADSDAQHILIRATHGSLPSRPLDVALARRLLAAQGGAIDETEQTTAVSLPR